MKKKHHRQRASRDSCSSSTQSKASHHTDGSAEILLHELPPCSAVLLPLPRARLTSRCFPVRRPGWGHTSNGPAAHPDSARQAFYQTRSHQETRFQLRHPHGVGTAQSPTRSPAALYHATAPEPSPPCLVPLLLLWPAGGHQGRSPLGDLRIIKALKSTF